MIISEGEKMKPVNLVFVSVMLAISCNAATAKTSEVTLNKQVDVTKLASIAENKTTPKVTAVSQDTLNASTQSTSKPKQPNIDKILTELNKQHNNASSLVKSARQPVSLSINSSLLTHNTAVSPNDNVLERLTAVASNTVNKFKQSGVASWYGRKFHGQQTASGEIFDMNAMTAAHRSLQFGCYVKVTNKDNGKTVVVKINDRGPFKGNRVLDLSQAAAEKIGLTKKGVGNVTIERVSAPANK